MKVELVVSETKTDINTFTVREFVNNAKKNKKKRLYLTVKDKEVSSFRELLANNIILSLTIKTI